MCSYAQTKRYCCEVKGIEKELSSGLKILVDFGNQAYLICGVICLHFYLNRLIHSQFLSIFAIDINRHND